MVASEVSIRRQSMDLIYLACATCFLVLVWSAIAGCDRLKRG